MVNQLKMILLVLVFVSNGTLLADDPNDNQAKNTKAKDKEIKLLKVDGAEALAKSYSLEKATNYLDRSSLAWTKKHKCFTCHTNFIHLIASSDLKTKPEYFSDVRSSLDEMVTKRWQEKGPRWDAEVIMSATTLAFLDRGDHKKLSPNTRMALDRIWKVQRKDGGFDWLKCDWPPMESDDEYGAAIAAVGLSAAPEEYVDSDVARPGVVKLKKYIKTNGLKKLHHRAMLIWADSLGGDWISDKESKSVVSELLKLQNDDGGWSSPSIGNWTRDDGKQTDENSDGYGTGFTVFILRRSGLAKDHVAIQKGISWLKKNQRESGRWYTRSMSRDNKHYLTNAGTAMAIMALNECK